VTPPSHFEAQGRVGGPLYLTVKFGAGVVESGDAGLDIAWFRGVAA